MKDNYTEEELIEALKVFGRDGNGFIMWQSCANRSFRVKCGIAFDQNIDESGDAPCSSSRARSLDEIPKAFRIFDDHEIGKISFKQLEAHLEGTRRHRVRQAIEFAEF